MAFRDGETAKQIACESDGNIEYWTCSKCGTLFSDAEGKTEITAPVTVAALGHDFGEWTQTKAPTCTEAGVETHTCSRCDATETRTVAALGHDYDAVVTEPTYTEGGYTTHTCSRCGDSYTDSQTDALGLTINTHPASTSATLGSNATFKVVAYGTDLTYEWQYQKPGESNWNKVRASGGNSATFVQTNVEARHDGYQFRCKVAGSGTTIISEAATLTVDFGSVPKITSDPASTSATLGSTATFKVAASGTGLTYKWQYQKPGESTWNDVQIGGTSATFNQTNVASRHNGYQFRCKVTNAAGYVISDAATLTVDIGSVPKITSHPDSTLVTLGSTATFKVVASGTGLTYQWQYKKPGESTWKNVQIGGTSATFAQTNVEARHDGYQFRCKVTNAAGYVISDAATLTVATGPIITMQPTSVTASLGSTATFKVVASGTGLSYQWTSPLTRTAI